MESLPSFGTLEWYEELETRGQIAACAMVSALALTASTAAIAGGGVEGAWKVVSIGAAAVNGPTLTVEGGKASGFGGCNRFGGSVEVDCATLRFGPLAATRMACDQLAVEQTYFDALGGVRGYKIDGDKLTLTSDGGTALVMLKR